ncbi:MAG TPA: hypothetical protein DCQ37_06105 [Desulfobacteraceae bacterium]|nr:hypothetical protein [Desulfobacteraceae bacterium]
MKKTDKTQYFGQFSGTTLYIIQAAIRIFFNLSPKAELIKKKQSGFTRLLQSAKFVGRLQIARLNY